MRYHRYCSYVVAVVIVRVLVKVVLVGVYSSCIRIHSLFTIS